MKFFNACSLLTALIVLPLGSVLSAPRLARADSSQVAQNTRLRQVQALKRIGGNARSFPYSIDYLIVNGHKFFVKSGPGFVVRASSGANISVGGWAVDAVDKSVAGGVQVVVDDRKTFATLYGGTRPDVARIAGTSYRNSGFILTFRTRGLARGQHFLRIRILTTSRASYYEPPQKVRFSLQ